MRASFLASYRCIDNIYRKKSFSGQELNKFLTDLPADDRPLTTKLVYGVVDKNIQLTYIIKQFAKSVKPAVLPILQIGVYGFLYLSLPNAVVVNECVELSKAVGKGGVKSFINAVLKNISEAVQNDGIKYPTDKKTCLSVKYGWPLWAVEKLVADYGCDIAEKIVSFEKDDRFFHIRINTAKTSWEDFEALLHGQGAEYKKTLPDGCFVRGTLDGVDKSLFTVQSLSSMYVCKAVGAESGKRLLDVCAAPGGKSVYLAQSGMEVVACDIHPHRVELIKKYAAKMGARLTASVCDAAAFNPDFEEKFDKVLCDVPCSGFGVVDSKPDVKLFKQEEDIGSLAELQYSILQNASRYLKKGGSLVYSTCTLFKEENDGVVNKFLSANKNFSAEEIDLPFEKTKEGYIQFLPYRDGTDGFFMAKIKRDF